jgi:hypothetical protein
MYVSRTRTSNRWVIGLKLYYFIIGEKMNPHLRIRILIGAGVFLVLLGGAMLVWRIFIYQRFPGFLNYVEPALSILIGLLALTAAFSRRN